MKGRKTDVPLKRNTSREGVCEDKGSVLSCAGSASWQNTWVCGHIMLLFCCYGAFIWVQLCSLPISGFDVTFRGTQGDKYGSGQQYSMCVQLAEMLHIWFQGSHFLCVSWESNQQYDDLVLLAFPVYQYQLIWKWRTWFAVLRKLCLDWNKSYTADSSQQRNKQRNKHMYLPLSPKLTFSKIMWY